MRILIQISIGLLILISISSCGNQKRNFNSTVDSSWVQIFKLSLIQKYEYRNLPSYQGNVEVKDVYLLDSNIVKDNLPKLPVGKLIPISLNEINEKAKQQRDAFYIYLALLQKDSMTAKVIWHDVIAIYSKRFGKVVHLVRKVDIAEYRLSKKGWVGGFSRTEVYTLSRPD